jgi:hypothetical protein
MWPRLSDAERPVLGGFLALFAAGYVAEFLLAQHVAQSDRPTLHVWCYYAIAGVGLLLVAVYVIPPL